MFCRRQVGNGPLAIFLFPSKPTAVLKWRRAGINFYTAGRPNHHSSAPFTAITRVYLPPLDSSSDCGSS
jgi:hypothetical protein